MDAFKYCPVCGGLFKTNSLIEKECTACGYVYFIAPKPSAGAIVVDEEGAILFIRRNRNPFKGTLDIPAGFADEGETIEACLRREMLEEIGLDTAKTKCQYFCSIIGDYEFKGVTKRFLNAVFTVTIDDATKAQLREGDDASDLQFIKPADLDFSEIGFEEVRKLVQIFIAKV